MSSEQSKRLNPMVITDPDEGREYTLEFTRRTVVKLERAGFDLNKMDSSPMTMIPLMFWGAFLARHPSMTREQTDKILFEGLGGLGEEEMAYLGKLYSAPFQTLIAGSDESANPRKMAVKF